MTTATVTRPVQELIDLNEIFSTFKLSTYGTKVTVEELQDELRKTDRLLEAREANKAMIAALKAKALELSKVTSSPNSPFRSIEPTSTTPKKIKEIKDACYEVMGVRSAKEVRRYLIAKGMEVVGDLRRRDSWLLIQAFLTQTTVAV